MRRRITISDGAQAVSCCPTLRRVSHSDTVIVRACLFPPYRGLFQGLPVKGNKVASTFRVVTGAALGND